MRIIQLMIFIHSFIDRLSLIPVLFRYPLREKHIPASWNETAETQETEEKSIAE